jgi:ADP-ribose pyrophosphatase
MKEEEGGNAGNGAWRDLAREVVCDGPHLKVFCEQVATPTRPCGVDWMVARRKQAAVVAPRTRDGNFLLVRQERVPVRRALWEFPAGQVDGEPTGEAVRETAIRELGEETGYEIGGELISLGTFYSSAGFTDECMHLFLATDVTPRADGHKHDDDEAILECRAFPLESLRAMIASGELCDANTLSVVARLWATEQM